MQFCDFRTRKSQNAIWNLDSHTSSRGKCSIPHGPESFSLCCAYVCLVEMGGALVDTWEIFFVFSRGPFSELLLTVCPRFPATCAALYSPLRGSRLGPAGGAKSSTLSNGGSASLFGCGGAAHAQPRAVPATTCWTATASIPHQRLDHPAAAAVLTAGGARCARTRTRSRTKRATSPFQRPPTSDPNTRRRWGPARRNSG